MSSESFKMLRHWMLEIVGMLEIHRNPDLNMDCQVFRTDAAPSAETVLKAILPNELPTSLSQSSQPWEE